MKIANAFSLSMVAHLKNGRVDYRIISEQEAKALLSGKVESLIGHEGTAQVFSQRLGIPIPSNRVFYQGQIGDTLIVGQVSGRLPEGKVLTSEELKDIPILWILVSIREECKQ